MHRTEQECTVVRATRTDSCTIVTRQPFCGMGAKRETCGLAERIAATPPEFHTGALCHARLRRLEWGQRRQTAKNNTKPYIL